MNLHLSPASLIEHIVLHVYFGRAALLFHKFAEPNSGFLAVLANGATQIELMILVVASIGILLLVVGKRQRASRELRDAEWHSHADVPSSALPHSAMAVDSFIFEQETTTTETTTKSVKVIRKIVNTRGGDVGGT